MVRGGKRERQDYGRHVENIRRIGVCAVAQTCIAVFCFFLLRPLFHFSPFFSLFSCLDKISKNGLVWCAMWGDPFLSSACSSFALIWRNLGRVAAIHVVSEVILLIGKIAIMAMTVGLSALILNNAAPWKNTVSSAFVPCILIAILAYAVAWIFFLTFETVIDTTFLSVKQHRLRQRHCHML